MRRGLMNQPIKQMQQLVKIKMNTKASLLVSIIFFAIVNTVAGSGFLTVTVGTTPLTVSAQATLIFYAYLATGYFQNGQVISFTMTGGSFIPSNQISLCTVLSSAANGTSIAACQLTANQVSMSLQVTANSAYIQVEVQNYINPYSATPLIGITTKLTTSTGTTVATHSTAILSNLVPDALKAASITPNSEIVGDKLVSIDVSFTTKNTLYTTGQVIMYFPLWNPNQGPSAFPIIQADTPNCANVQGMNPAMTCTYNFNTQYLTIYNPLKVNAGPSSTLIFSVDSLFNPYSGIPRTGFKIITTDNIGGYIDSSVVAGLTISLTVTAFAPFDVLQLSRVDTMQTVGELSTGSIYFSLDLPIDANCQIQITFPPDMPLTTDLTQITSAGLADETLVPPTSINLATNSFYLSGCSAYMTSIGETLTMYKMKNKGHVMATQSFIVTLWAISNGVSYPIAQQSTGVVFQQSDFVAGTITQFKLTPVDSSEVQNYTRYEIQLWPVHFIPTSSMITVQFPSSINLTTGSCTVQAPVLPITVAAQCSVNANLVTITYPFAPSGSFTANSNGLQFNISPGGNNPLSEKDSGSFIVNTYAIDTGAPYQIDENMFFSVFTAHRGTIGMSISLISSYQTYYSPSTYTFQVTPTKLMPAKSYMIIEMPTVITLTGATVPSCTYIINGQSYTSTIIQTLSTSQRPLNQATEEGQSLGTIISPNITIQFNDAFTNMWYLNPGTPFQVICNGFRNPRTTRVTSTFNIQTFDMNGYYLEQNLAGITADMLITPNMPTFSVTMSNFTNGAVNTYLFSTYSPLPHFTGDILQFTFPLESILPTTLVCIPLGALSAINCVQTGPNTVAATLSFTNAYIDVGVQITFQMLNVENPPDTRLSSPFTNVIMTDPLQYQLTQYIGITTLQTLYFATIQVKSLAQTYEGLLVNSNYTFTYQTINRMPAGSAFQITYPSTIQPPSVLPVCHVQYAGIGYDLNGCAVDQVNLVISISGGFNAAVTAGSTIAITIGPMITPITQLNPGIFTLKSFVSNQYKYFIDESLIGLAPLFECDHPCRTCALPSRTQCLSCETNVPTETYVYLDNMMCLTVCPDGLFGDIYNDKICTLCQDKCLTCSDVNTCTRCKGNSGIMEFYQGQCYPSCNAGLCPIDFKCSPCNAPPFTQITVTANPSTVGLVSFIQLTATLSPLSPYYATGDLVWLLIPAPGAFIISNDTSQLWRSQKFGDYFSNISLCLSVKIIDLIISRQQQEYRLTIAQSLTAEFYYQSMSQIQRLEQPHFKSVTFRIPLRPPLSQIFRPS